MCKLQCTRRNTGKPARSYLPSVLPIFDFLPDYYLDILTQGNQAMPVKTNQPVLPVQSSDLGGRGGIDMALITAILAGF